MSRSYKYPIFKDKTNKYFKRLSNKKIRKYLKKLNQGFKSSRFFKTIEESWNICDWTRDPRDKDDYNKALRK